MTSQEVEIRGKRLTLSNLDKILYPKAGFTKAQVIDYYLRAAPAVLPHLRDRPLTLKRYPNGVEAPYFYEKNCPSHRPHWVKTADVWSDQNQRTMKFCLAQDVATLAWAANLADLELHVPLHPHAPPAAAIPTAPTASSSISTPAPPLASCNAARSGSSSATPSSASACKRSR